MTFAEEVDAMRQVLSPEDAQKEVRLCMMDSCRYDSEYIQRAIDEYTDLMAYANATNTAPSVLEQLAIDLLKDSAWIPCKPGVRGRNEKEDTKVS